MYFMHPEYLHRSKSINIKSTTKFSVFRFSEGSVVVDFTVILEALENAKADLYDTLVTTVTDAIANGNLGSLKVDPDSLAITCKCDLSFFVL